MEEAEGVFACLLYDSTLKTVLEGVENEELFIEMIEFLIPGKHIASIRRANKEKHGLVLSEKVTIFDLLCQDADTGEEFLVEVQNAPDRTYRDRALYYSLVPVREQMERKQRYGKGKEEETKSKAKEETRRKMDYSIRPIYVISLVNFDFKHESPETLEEGYVSRYELRSGKSGELMTNALNFVFVEMARLPYAKDEYDKCRNRLERFIFAFKYMHTFVEFPDSFRSDALLGKLAEAAELANMSVVKREEYDTAMKDEFARLVENNCAREEGRAEGMAEGLEKGKAEGRAEGAREQAIQSARNFLKLGFPVEVIAQGTGLTAEEVEALRCGE
jgi:predicted transposase/invertase (TIGR01784 family)